MPVRLSDALTVFDQQAGGRSKFFRHELWRVSPNSSASQGDGGADALHSERNGSTNLTAVKKALPREVVAKLDFWAVGARRVSDRVQGIFPASMSGAGVVQIFRNVFTPIRSSQSPVALRRNAIRCSAPLAAGVATSAAFLAIR